MPENRFATAAPHYAVHRPGHDDRVFTHARERFGLDDRDPDRSWTRVLYLAGGVVPLVLATVSTREDGADHSGNSAEAHPL